MPFKLELVPGNGACQLFQSRFDVSWLFSAGRGDGGSKRPLGYDDSHTLRTQDLDGATQQLTVFLLLRLRGKYDILRCRWILQGRGTSRRSQGALRKSSGNYE